jgi:hypothetical protein
MVVAMALTMLVFAITLPFVRTQSRALGDNAGRLDADQVARYAQRVIDRDLRVAVADVGQPLIVYAGPMGIAFNANLIARDTVDPSALALDASADTTLSEAWRVGQASTIPRAARTYPTQTYLDAAGVPSRNETVMYFLHPDTVTGRNDVYVLYRRVNGRDSTQVVRGIHVPADSAFFSYFTMTGGVMTRVAAASLPLFWDSTSVGSVRAVGVRSAGFFRNAQTGEDVIRTVFWTVTLENRTPVGRNCGAAPATPPASNASQFRLTLEDNDHPLSVLVEFDRSADDNGASADVTHYVIERKFDTSAVWRHVATVPARREAEYFWTDVRPPLSGAVNYGVRAVDCGGLSSGRATRSSVTLP